MIYVDNLVVGHIQSLNVHWVPDEIEICYVIMLKEELVRCLSLFYQSCNKLDVVITDIQ